MKNRRRRGARSSAMAGSLVQRLLAEYVGTLYLLFIIALSGNVLPYIAIGFGLMILVYSLGVRGGNGDGGCRAQAVQC